MLKKALAIGAILFALWMPNAAIADDEGVTDDQNEQVIPPAVDGTDQSVTRVVPEPIDVSKIKVTTMTPADEFTQAITPLVVALGAGSIALVVYTLLTQSKGTKLPD